MCGLHPAETIHSFMAPSPPLTMENSGPRRLLPPPSQEPSLACLLCTIVFLGTELNFSANRSPGMKKALSASLTSTS